VNFSAYSKRRFNNLRANFVREIPREEFFNTYRRSHNFASFLRLKTRSRSEIGIIANKNGERLDPADSSKRAHISLERAGLLTASRDSYLAGTERSSSLVPFLAT